MDFCERRQEMAKARDDRVAGYRILLANLLGKVWKVHLGIIRERRQAAAELRSTRWGNREGVCVEQWRKLTWITEGQARKAEALRDALVDFLYSNEPIDEQHLWPIVAEALDHEISFDEYEGALITIETKYGRSTRATHATQAFYAMVGMEVHEGS